MRTVQEDKLAKVFNRKIEPLTPREIVQELDKYIIGQHAAKRAVAIALRNRWRRQQVEKPLQDEIMPKNIIMIGPTGVGKTEIARRLANLAQAPFIKVEATKFTEVGYVGRDVESMVRDLTEIAVQQVKREAQEAVQDTARALAEERLVGILMKHFYGEDLEDEKESEDEGDLEEIFGFMKALLGKDEKGGKAFIPLFGGSETEYSQEETSQEDEEEKRRRRIRQRRARLLKRLRAGELDDEIIEIEVPERLGPMLEIFSSAGIEEMGLQFKDVFGNLFGAKMRKRKVKVKDALDILTNEEAQKLIDMEEIVKEAIRRVEQTGIIFIDEIDKIASRAEASHSGPDVSREGVQRDILPLVEGSTVMTKYGPVRTHHILFIAAGAFHISKPSDLIPELQGRFPIRVELEALSVDDFVRILTEPENSLVKQYKAMMATEGVELEFTEEGLRKIAEIAFEINERAENIGARRLYTVMEKLLEEVLFEGPEITGAKIPITAQYVEQRLKDVIADEDLSRYIL